MAASSPPVKDALVVGVALAVLTISAQVKPFVGTPFEAAVPGTLQTLALLVAAAWIGARRAAWTALIYLLLGFIGVPVFSGWAARIGLDFALYPYAGYLLGFIPAAAFVGWAFRQPHRFSTSLAIMLCGHAIVLACGFLVLLAWNQWEYSLEHGVLRLLPGMAVKTLLGATIVYFFSIRLARKTSSKAD